jgi:hypothetical protein
LQGHLNQASRDADDDDADGNGQPPLIQQPDVDNQQWLIGGQHMQQPAVGQLIDLEPSHVIHHHQPQHYSYVIHLNYFIDLIDLCSDMQQAQMQHSMSDPTSRIDSMAYYGPQHQQQQQHSSSAYVQLVHQQPQNDQEGAYDRTGGSNPFIT